MLFILYMYILIILIWLYKFKDQMAKICQNEENLPAEEATLPVTIYPTWITVIQVSAVELATLEVPVAGITTKKNT